MEIATTLTPARSFQGIIAPTISSRQRHKPKNSRPPTGIAPYVRVGCQPSTILAPLSTAQKKGGYLDPILPQVRLVSNADANL